MVGALLTSLIVTEEYGGLCPSNFVIITNPSEPRHFMNMMHGNDHSQAIDIILDWCMYAG